MTFLFQLTHSTQILFMWRNEEQEEEAPEYDNVLMFVQQRALKTKLSSLLSGCRKPEICFKSLL